MTMVAVAKVSLAAGTMCWLLTELAPRLRQRREWPVLVLLATGYACSSWTWNIALYTVQWLDSLYTFPLLCLAGL